MISSFDLFEKKRVYDFAQEHLANRESGHDFAHALRVLKNAQYIAQQEPFPHDQIHILEISALLHDVIDYKFCEENEPEGYKKIEFFLLSLSIHYSDIQHIIEIISGISFHKRKNSSFSSPVFQIVQDADRLDAIGAIGIARVFSYGGYKKRDFSQSIQHFPDKLLLLKDLMNTDTAKHLAVKRHQRMLQFLQDFEEEQSLFDISDFKRSPHEDKTS